MTIDLPPPLNQYFAAKNRHDVDAMLVPFGDAAVVVDEGRTYVGKAEIRDWMVDTTARYRVTVEPTEASAVGEAWMVAALVSGDFPGSPAVLRYRFVATGRSIARLEIGA